MNVDYFTAIIRKKGTTAKQFCESLGTNYKSFRWRVRNGSLKLHEYKAIIKLTGKTFEQLFIDSVTSEDSAEHKEQDHDTVEVKHKPLTSKYDGRKRKKPINQVEVFKEPKYKVSDTKEQPVAEPPKDDEEKDNFIDTF